MAFDFLIQKRIGMCGINIQCLPLGHLGIIIVHTTEGSRDGIELALTGISQCPHKCLQFTLNAAQNIVIMPLWALGVNAALVSKQ